MHVFLIQCIFIYGRNFYRLAKKIFLIQYRYSAVQPRVYDNFKEIITGYL